MDVQVTIRRTVKVTKTTTEFRLDIQTFTNRNNPVIDYLNFNSYKVEFEDPLGILPMVGLEPLELLTLRDEYLHLIDENDLDKAKEISKYSCLYEKNS